MTTEPSGVLAQVRARIQLVAKRGAFMDGVAHRAGLLPSDVPLDMAPTAAALLAVLDLHYERQVIAFGLVCDECYNRDYPELWPCPTVGAIQAAFKGARP